MPPEFLTLEEVLKIHQDQIERYGGATGVRDTKVLRSALAMPHAGAGGEYCHGDLFEMAAAYLVHLVRNHAFIDGDQHVGTVAAIAFLDLNGIEITVGEDDFVELVLGVATGQVTKADVADFLRRCARGE